MSMKKYLNRLKKYDLIDIICRELKLPSDILVQLERTHKTICFGSLIVGMRIFVRGDRSHPPEQYYDMQRAMKMYLKKDIIDMILKIRGRTN